MLSTRGLALEQAPPFDLPARFFLTAPLYAVSAGVLIAWDGGAMMASRWTPAALAAVHLIAVGFLSQIMCGALLQMLPVLAGSPVPRVWLVGTWVHILLSLGAGMLAWGLWRGGEALLVLGAGTTALGFLVFLGPVVAALLRARGVPHTVQAMRIAVAALTVTVVLGLLLIGALTGWLELPGFLRWVDAHAAMGLMGWIGALIVAVAYQLVPMFYVTPSYPEQVARWLVPAAGAAVGAGGAIWVTGGDTLGLALLAVAAAGFLLFAVLTVRLLRRSHRQADVTWWHWWVAMGSLCIAVAAWVASAPPPLIGVFLLIGVGVGLPAGMLLKILPFLSWFHLQHAQMASGRLDVRVPFMRGFISERSARVHLVLHLSALALLTASVPIPWLARPGGIALGLSALFFEALLLAGIVRYRRVASALRTPVDPLPVGRE